MAIDFTKTIRDKETKEIVHISPGEVTEGFQLFDIAETGELMRLSTLEKYFENYEEPEEIEVSVFREIATGEIIAEITGWKNEDKWTMQCYDASRFEKINDKVKITLKEKEPKLEDVQLPNGMTAFVEKERETLWDKRIQHCVHPDCKIPSHNQFKGEDIKNALVELLSENGIYDENSLPKIEKAIEKIFGKELIL